MQVDYLSIPEITISYRDAVRVSERASVYSSIHARDIFREVFSGFMQHHEEFWVMYLNRANKVLGISQVSRCGISSTMVDVRIIMQGALKANASAVLACHNHPSGNLRISEEDKNITIKIREACGLLNLLLVDHLILTEEGYASFIDEGLI